MKTEFGGSGFLSQSNPVVKVTSTQEYPRYLRLQKTTVATPPCQDNTTTTPSNRTQTHQS